MKGHPRHIICRILLSFVIKLKHLKIFFANVVYSKRSIYLLLDGKNVTQVNLI